MGLFNRNNKVASPKNNVDTDFLKEYAQAGGVDLYSFIQGIRSIDSNYINNDNLIEKMKDDSIISSAIDMWTEDALQRDPQSKEIFHIEIDNPDDNLEDKLSKGLSKELDRFLKTDLRMEKYLVPILKRVLIYGNCPVKLDFADNLADDKLELKESNKGLIEDLAGKIEPLFGNIEVDKAIDDTARLTESEYDIDWEQMGEDIVSTDNSQIKLLRDSIESSYNKILNESNVSVNLNSFTRMVKGRWYTETLGRGTNIYELSSKQKVIAYMDRDNPNKFIKPDRIVNFTNNTGKHKVTFELGDRNLSVSKKQYFNLERGESFIENSMQSWQVLNALEDILLLTRMTRSILYRIFSVEVGAKGNKETKDLLDRLKNKIKMDETVDIRSKIYNSSLTQVPLGDSIFIPTRNGVGVIDVKTVGGDVNLKDAVDLDYFKDKLFAGLRIPAPFLGFTESLPGGIGDTSLTRMDIRYSRTITRIQTILAEGLKDLCLIYLKLTRTSKAFEELPDFKVVFTSVNSAEDLSRTELKQTQMQTLQNLIDNLSKLGVDIENNSEGYEQTRQELIKQFYGSIILEKILADEKAMPVQNPTEGDSGNLSNDKPSSGPSFNVDIGPSGPTDMGVSNNDEVELDNNEPDINNDEPVEDIEVDNPDTDIGRELG